MEFCFLGLRKRQRNVCFPQRPIKKIVLLQKSSPRLCPPLRVNQCFQGLGDCAGQGSLGLSPAQPFQALERCCYWHFLIPTENVASEGLEIQLTVWMFERVKPNFNITLKKNFVFIYTTCGSFLFCFPGGHVNWKCMSSYVRKGWRWMDKFSSGC